MAKLDMFCGMLGAGKTTLIKQMLPTVYAGHKVAIIENEYVKVNLDAGELAEASISVKELTSGCVCCTIKGDLKNAVQLLIQQEEPEYIIVEASGVADLRSLIQVCGEAVGVTVNRVITVVNAKKILKLLKVVGNFFRDQLRVSYTIYLNFSDELTEDAIAETKNALLEINPALKFVTTSLSQIEKDTFPDKAEAIVHAAPKAFGRLAVGRNLNRTRQQVSSNMPDLQSWEVSFAKSFSPSQVEKLISILSDESRHTLWRAKGYLNMEDGSIRKVDYTFGDAFEEDRETVAEENRNLLVLIGPNLDTQWLEEQFDQIFQK